MSWLSSWLHPERGYKAGQEQLDKYYNEAQNSYNPYMQNGQNAGNNLNDYMNQFMDPQALQDKWSQGYETSGAAKDAMGMAQQNGLDAASSMGLMGSSAGLQALQAGTSQIQNADKQQYLDDLMKKYMAGADIAGNMYGTGANAANQFGQNAMNQGQNSAQMQFGQKNAGGSTFGNLLGTAGGIAGGIMAPGLSSKFGQMIGAPQQQGFNPYGQGQGVYR
jgi:hypothetical protein